MYICTQTPPQMHYEFVACGKGGEVYSCDKLVLGLKAYGRDAQPILDWLARQYRLMFTHWISFNLGTYRDQFTVSCENGGSFWLGIGLNTCGFPSVKAVRLEANPNKVCETAEFVAVWQMLRVYTVGRTQLIRWDLACDYAIDREQLTLVKDRRLYEEMRHSAADRTQYLGQRNMSGRVKLYNKQLESKLGAPLTRLEMTLSLEDSAADRVTELWPLIYGSGYDVDVSALSDTDAFILRTLTAEPDRVTELGRRKRDKLEPLLSAARKPLPFDREAYNAVLRQISEFIFGRDASDISEFVPALGQDGPDFDVPLALSKRVVQQLEWADTIAAMEAAML